METHDPQEPSPPTKPPSGDLPAFNEAGVDMTLIRWMLSMTPMERLMTLQRNARAILRIRRGFKRT